jgi:hypothetical protein
MPTQVRILHLPPAEKGLWAPEADGGQEVRVGRVGQTATSEAKPAWRSAMTRNVTAAPQLMLNARSSGSTTSNVLLRSAYSSTTSPAR